MASVATRAIQDLEFQMHRVEAKVDIILAHLGVDVPTHSEIAFNEDGELIEYAERGHLKGPLSQGHEAFR
jgi:diacylglycerol kinase family enzyme